MTANLAGGRADAQEFARLVEAWAPDAVAVQEIHESQAGALSRVLPFGAIHAAPRGSGLGIVLRRAGPTREIGLRHRNACAAELVAGDLRVELINVHMIAPHIAPLWRTTRMRGRQLRALEEYLDRRPPSPRVVVGDLNATPLWPVYRRLARRLRDGAVECAGRAGRRPLATWRPFPGWPCLLRIDHVLSEGLSVERLEVLAVPGSDHCALVADLRVDAAAPDADQGPDVRTGGR
jgi:endonuclease/exonuclease/phosphatase family metal-dependent hydrolase